MLHFSLKPFSALSNEELYRILQLRQEIFIVEQSCPYLDCDDKDLEAYHVLGKNEAGQLLAYTRLLDKGSSYENHCSIGRVVTSATIRNTGAGRLLMLYSMKEIDKLFPDIPVKISSQSYIAHFYESLGFVKIGEEYLEDNIPHIAMILKG